MNEIIPASPAEAQLVTEVINSWYALDPIITIEKNTYGNVNRTFIVTTASKKVVLRESSSETTNDHLQFEVEALEYFKKQQFSIVPHILNSTTGEHIVHHKGARFMLQNFIGGQVVASWNNPELLTPEQFDNIFKTCARFARAAELFVPSRVSTFDNLPRSIDQTIRTFDSLVSTMPDSPGKTLLLEQRNTIIDFTKETQEIFRALNYDSLPQQLVHFDMHPGNFHFENNTVVGLFDFDWACMDTRFADLAGTLCQSCFDFSTTKTGAYQKEKIRRGVMVYRNAYGKSNIDEELENKICAASLRGFLSVQLLWLLGWYTRHAHETDALYIAQYWSQKIYAMNNFDQFFDGI